MSVWHGDLHKKKRTGGRKRSPRKKRRFETGSFPTETIVGEPKTKVERGRGGNLKVRLVKTNQVNVSDPLTGETKKVEILRVLRNPANVDYDRRDVMTKGALLETPLGTARVTSRPGQSGVLNAILIRET
ncbi:MAG: 30S ribosomal protein S8e [Candidatus Bathyarchaeota archaeon]|nr:30S ribosomal protein S8e [Candidatus Bathyarchaeota archaeon]